MQTFHHGPGNLYIMPSSREVYYKPIRLGQLSPYRQRWRGLKRRSPRFLLRQVWQVHKGKCGYLHVNISASILHANICASTLHVNMLRYYAYIFFMCICTSAYVYVCIILFACSIPVYVVKCTCGSGYLYLMLHRKCELYPIVLHCLFMVLEHFNRLTC